MDSRVASERDFHNDAFANHKRQTVDKFYSVTAASKRHYESLLIKKVQGKSALEYGCGPGSYAYALAQAGARVTGIDISDVAIAQASKLADESEVSIDFQVMDAENLSFPNRSFDLVCGSGILHHLDLHKSCSQIARVLTNGGRAVFYEPMGHNVFINLYRRATPHLRTKDEHPLLWSDLKLFEQYFGSVEINFYCLTTLLAVPFRKTNWFTGLIDRLESLDRKLRKALPTLKRFSWIAVIELGSPIPRN